MTSRSPARLDPAVWSHHTGLPRVIDAISRDGDMVRLVGGAVRNPLLGEPVDDIDLATTALPNTVVARTEAAGLKAIPTGIAHGTITIVADHEGFEVTTLRRDVETFGRHATVAFTRDWHADAARRDFTINALYADVDGTLHDPVGGLADLAERRIRFIGDAGERIREDYLRILRFFRFHARYASGAPDPTAIAAITAHADGLATLSAERVGAETLKLVVARHAAATLALMAEIGIAARVFGFAPDVPARARLPGPDATDPLRALASLIPDTPDAIAQASALSARLRLSNPMRDRLIGALQCAPSLSGGPEDRAARIILHRAGAGAFRDALALAMARDGMVDAPDWARLRSLPERHPIPPLPITGQALIARGWSAGPALGAALRRIEAAWIARDFDPDPAPLWDAAGLPDASPPIADPGKPRSGGP